MEIPFLKKSPACRIYRAGRCFSGRGMSFDKAWDESQGGEGGGGWLLESKGVQVSMSCIFGALKGSYTGTHKRVQTKSL